MANFLAVYDAKERRRITFEQKCKEEIAIFGNLKRDHISCDCFSILWAVNNRAPVDTYRDGKQIAVVLGEAIRPGQDERLSAKKITREWNSVESAKTLFYDGYYCTINYSTEKGVIIGGDILGLFPIYYYFDNEITLVGSSPELFKYHDRFEPELCVEGLSGMLLTMHSVEGLTLWKNVRRLQAGHLLVDNKEAEAEEILQYQLPLSHKYYDLPFSHQIELMHEKMGEAVTRHAPDGEKYSLLFSGGLDSRMLGGYLQNQEKDITAITLGKSSDKEMEIAKKVMRTLPFQHTAIEISFDDYVSYANLTARWEHGLHGFNMIQLWGLKEILEKEEASKVISGIHHDSVFHANYARKIRDADDSEAVFLKIFSMVNQWGIQLEDLRELLSFDISSSTPNDIRGKLKERFYRLSDSDYERTWYYELFHRARFHHGGGIWKMSFGAWPVIPIIDSAVLEIMAGVPFATKSNRRAQRDLVSTYFPELARIPLDNNSNKPDQLIPTWQYLLWQTVMGPELINRAVNGIKRRLTGPWHTNLYYHRIFNIDNQGWKSIRKEAEPARSLTSDIFNQSTFHQLLPDAQENIDKRLWETSGQKSLLGFLLWEKNNRT